MESIKNITICYTDSGGGHRATAMALQAVLNRETSYVITLLNPYRELIPDIDLFPRFTGYTAEEIYNRFVLGKNWPHFACLLYFVLSMLDIKLGTRKSAERFLTYWQKEKPDLVISVMPMANQGIYRSVRAYTSKCPLPFLVVMTDLEEKMKHAWFPADKDYYIACGSEKAYRQALKSHPQHLVFHTSGLIVRPDFYDQTAIDPAAERTALGLLPDWPTGCMMYGAAGSKRMIELARALQQANQKCQMIFLCGHNQVLADTISGMNLPYPHRILTYTTEIPYYFSLSDFLVCKPGPGTISEALVSRLTLLLDRRNVLPQERYNLKWILENKLGLAFGSTMDFQHVVRKILSRRIQGDSRPSAPEIPENRGIFEMSRIIQKIIEV